MKTYSVILSNGKSATVLAPSPQRARQRIEREIDRLGSKVTVSRVDVKGH